MNQTKVSTEALQLLTGDEAFHYRLVPYEVDPDANLYCFSDKDKDYDAIIHEIAIFTSRKFDKHMIFQIQKKIKQRHDEKSLRRKLAPLLI